VPRPHIDSPVSGDVVAPGALAVRGTAESGALVEVRNQGSGTVLALAAASDQGIWDAVVELRGEGSVTLIAVVPGPDGLTLTSDPVEITLAPPVPPNTGGAQTGDPNETGRAFTALLALLLSAGGFSAYFAGRLLFLVTKDRLRLP
jgi:hypothetical protein